MQQRSTPVNPKQVQVDNNPFICIRRYTCEDPVINSIHPYFFEFLDMVSVKRRYDTRSEIAFRSTYFSTLGLSENKTITFDKLKDPEGNVLAYVYKVSDAPVLWSSHIDSVHSGSGNVKVAFDSVINLVYVEDESCPLGSDDAAGIWIMFQMIRAGIEGTYIFHVGEEVGGIGSTGVAEHHKDFLSKFKAAIAFDRKDTCSVITHQAWGRCCSDAFADSFIKSVNAQGLSLVKDDTGIFTDTANYIDLIGECTNISVGYYDEHTQKESIDVEYLVNLLNALVAVFKDGVDALVFNRKPGEPDLDQTYYQSCQRFGFEGKGWTNYRQNKYSKKSKKDELPPWEFSTEYEHADDLDEIETIEESYFNLTQSGFYKQVTFNREILNDPLFLAYEDQVQEAIDDLCTMQKKEIEDFVSESSEGFVVSVIRKLLKESGYI